MKLIVALVLLLSALPALSAENALQDRIGVCESCHGSEGIPVSSDIPILAGQEFYYLYVQLKDYQAGRRENPIMSPMVSDLSKDEMKALAEHFSTMEWPRIDSSPVDALVDAGEGALNAGQCSQCHSTYQGDSRIPRLAGQQLSYLKQTMEDFKNKVRLNSAAKGSLMKSFSDEDLEAMAHRLSGL